MTTTRGIHYRTIWNCMVLSSVAVVVSLLSFSWFLEASQARRGIAAQRHKVLLLPVDQPDPFPQRQLDCLRERDPTPLDTACDATSRVEVIRLENEPFWILHTLDMNGTRKHVGGDEYYLTYIDEMAPDHSRIRPLPDLTHHPSGIAHIVDLRDGRYELHFVKSRLSGIPKLKGSGTLKVVLQFTCGIGMLDPPLKQKWNASGAMNRTWHVAVEAPPMRDPTPVPSFPELADYDTVWAVGDSLMQQFIGTGITTFPEESNDQERRVNLRLGHDFRSPLSRDTFVESGLRDALQQKMFIAMGENSTNEKEKSRLNSAIILGSGVWDILRNNDAQVSLEDHIKAVEAYVEFVKQGAPHNRIYWKSMTAMHIHIAPECERVMYMSSSRAEKLYRAQVDLMDRLGVPVLDMYNITYESADWARPGDGRHFQVELNDMIMDLIYPLYED